MNGPGNISTLLYVGYVILPRYYHLDGYEPRLMSFYGSYVPDYFDELIRTMSQSMMTQQP